ncbi:double zinc ribbon domain-containing protein [Halostella salina]|uniref:double zinc ribbon domain-containing protein n=1 Tax=Halostella salina TaxID=1547897 RepID=UPI000EF7DBEF|nr:zinc ribbon domain-containing protein [Halostella salina]
MSKITFRADDELVDELDRFDASKSEVLRRALRAYLEDREPSDADDDGGGRGTGGSIDELVAERVDAIVEQRLAEHTRDAGQDINVNISLDGADATDDSAVSTARKTATREQPEAADDASNTCGQCGEHVDAEHVYCPNCGEKATHRVFCDCGDELRTDWAFCPSCGRRTPAADVLDSP